MASRFRIDPEPTAADRELFRAHVPPPPNPGVRPYEMEDVLWQCRMIASGLLKEEEYAKAMRIPLDYLRALRARFRLVRPPG
jgi:hypothetical protein